MTNNPSTCRRRIIATVLRRVRRYIATHDTLPSRNYISDRAEEAATVVASDWANAATDKQWSRMVDEIAWKARVL